MYTFVWFSGAIWETPSKKTAVILSHRYVIGVKIVLRDNVGTLRTFLSAAYTAFPRENALLNAIWGSLRVILASTYRPVVKFSSYIAYGKLHDGSFWGWYKVHHTST